MSELHPATEEILKYFTYEHLPEHLQTVSKKFHHLAFHLAYHSGLEGPELTMALRKLLEAKDCAVRAAL